MNKIPQVILIGRQNVGKSTLFNALIKNKKAIIDPTPGVTRDVVFGEILINEKKVRIMDTGGISDEHDEINRGVQKKRLDAEKEADIILFVVEARNFKNEEIDYAKRIKKLNKKVIVAVNKCDTIEKDYYLNDFFRLGFKDIIPVSASHRRNIDILLENINSKLDEIDSNTIEIKEEKSLIKIAILGKPNVGKSSLLNKITGMERSIVTNIPGTTRDVVEEEFVFENKHFLILDTAGIRKKARVSEDVEYYSVNRAIKCIDTADLVYLVVDSTEELSMQDKKITSQIIKNGKGLIIVLNKWDLQEKKEKLFRDKKEMLLFRFPQVEYAPIVPVSAKTGEGISKLLKTSVKLYNELDKTIDTPTINKLLHDLTEKHHPSSKKGLLKLYYGTQVSKKPVKFIIFINKISLLSSNYKQYIVNSIREAFGFTGIPIDILFKDKSE